MRRVCIAGFLFGLGLVGFMPAYASAQDEALAPTTAPARLPIEIYGREARIDMIALSPSGRRVGRVEADNGVRGLIVSDLETGQRLFGAHIGESKVRGLSFIDEDRILVHVTQTESLSAIGGIGRREMSYGQIVDIRNNNVAQVLARTDGVLASPFGPVEVFYTAQGPLVLTRGYNVTEGKMNLHRIDLRTGRGRSVREMKPAISDYVANGNGELLAMTEYIDQTGRWTLKLMQDNWMKDNWTITALLDQPSLIGMGRTPGTVLISATRPDLTADEDISEDGSNLYEITVATGEWTRLPYEKYPRGFLYHPVTKLLIGLRFEEDLGARYAFFDDLASRRWKAIERAFPDQYPSPSDWSHDLGVVLVYIDKGDSGHYQLVNFANGRADLAGVEYPDLTPERVGKVSHLTYKAADGLEINAYMTLPPGVTEARNLPLVVLPHGGPAAHDGAGFDYWAQAIASRGYVVLQPNFRGSTGYGRAFVEAGYGEWGRKMQTDLSDGVRHLAAQGAIDPARVCIMGASYGGYAAMAAVTLDAEVYRCAVAVAGVSDLRLMLRWTVNRQGARNNPTTRYWIRFMGADGVRDRDLDAYSPVMQVDQIKAPLMLIHGKDDTVVPIEQSRVMAEALVKANLPHEYIELDGEDHWMSRASTRTRMLVDAIRFIESHNPAD